MPSHGTLLYDAVYLAAQTANTIVYVILTADKSSTDRRQAYSSMVEMNRLARETGGRMIDVGTSEKKIDIAFTQIEHELRAQYLAIYIWSNGWSEAAVKRLNVKCGKGEKVQVQRSYYAVVDETGQK